MPGFQVKMFEKPEDLVKALQNVLDKRYTNVRIDETDKMYKIIFSNFSKQMKFIRDVAIFRKWKWEHIKVIQTSFRYFSIQEIHLYK